MIRELRLIGAWDGAGFPDVCGFVVGDRDDEVLPYLRAGTVWAATAGIHRCLLCGRYLGTAELTDGERFVWPESVIHYVEEHGVRLPDEVRGLAPAPPVDLAWFEHAFLESGELTIDEGWWESQARPVRDHLPGCPNSPVLRWWQLPGRAPIWVDGVPVGDIRTMARLRRLLGTDWPFGALRSMSAGQPFEAVPDGRPVELHHAAGDLRGHLFYETGDGLRTIDVGD